MLKTYFEDLRTIFPNVDDYFNLYVIQNRTPIYRFEHNTPSFYIPEDRQHLIWHEIGHFLSSRDKKIKNFGLECMSYIDVEKEEIFAQSFYSICSEKFKLNLPWQEGILVLNTGVRLNIPNYFYYKDIVFEELDICPEQFTLDIVPYIKRLCKNL